MKEPRPSVHRTTLGDSAITYEITVVCETAQPMAVLYTQLHWNILDLFNNYVAQIMSPAHGGDSEVRKVMPMKQWFGALAQTSEPDIK